MRALEEKTAQLPSVEIVPVKTAKDMADQVNAFVEGRLDNQLIETKYLVQNNKNKSYDYEKDSLQLDEFMV